jgi:hypothetical protein
MNTDNRAIAVGVTDGRGADRRHRFPGRQHRINVRLDSEEYRDIAAAAARAGLTSTGFCADAALAAARHATPSDLLVAVAGVSRVELASLQRDLFAARTAVVRTGTNLNQAATILNSTGVPPVWLAHVVHRCDRSLGRLDVVVADIDRRLR